MPTNRPRPPDISYQEQGLFGSNLITLTCRLILDGTTGEASISIRRFDGVEDQLTSWELVPGVSLDLVWSQMQPLFAAAYSRARGDLVPF